MYHRDVLYLQYTVCTQSREAHCPNKVCFLGLFIHCKKANKRTKNPWLLLTLMLWLKKIKTLPVACWSNTCLHIYSCRCLLLPNFYKANQKNKLSKTDKLINSSYTGYCLLILPINSVMNFPENYYITIYTNITIKVHIPWLRKKCDINAVCLRLARFIQENLLSTGWRGYRGDHVMLIKQMTFCRLPKGGMFGSHTKEHWPR